MQETQTPEIAQTNNKSSFLPMALSLVALALAAAALFLAVNSAKKLDSAQETLTVKADKAIAASVEVSNIAPKLQSLANQINEVRSSTKTASNKTISDVKSALEYYSKLINENRELISANQEALKTIALELRDRPTKSQTRAKAQASEQQAAPKEQQKTEQTEQSATAATSGAKTYKIKSGDYLAKIAKKFKVSIKALQDANPGIEPSKLQIGQEINIPQQ
ncbi:MAG: LysM peptidoglycan-binding domain-containing protein [Opitutales bacterium]|nr:LysM peptidoglycan-binding domain-containing protein [Opitutales bacterium]